MFGWLLILMSGHNPPRHCAVLQGCCSRRLAWTGALQGGALTLPQAGQL